MLTIPTTITCVYVAVEVGFEFSYVDPLQQGVWDVTMALLVVLEEMWARVFLFDITKQIGWHNTNALISYPETFMERWAQLFSWR